MTCVNPNELEEDLMNLINKLASSEYTAHKQSMLSLVPIVIKNFQIKNKETILKYIKLI